MDFFGIKRLQSHALCVFFQRFQRIKTHQQKKNFFLTPTKSWTVYFLQQNDARYESFLNYNHTLYYESVVKIQWTPAKLLEKKSILYFALASISLFCCAALRRLLLQLFKLVLVEQPREIMWGVLTRRWSTLGFSRAINSKLWSGIVELYLLAITPY